MSSEADVVQSGMKCLEASWRDRRAVLARVASSVSHALGTPLNVITGRAAMVALDASDPEAVARHAAIIEEQARAIGALLQRLADLTRGGSPRDEPCDLDELLRAELTAVEPCAASRNVTLRREQIEILPACTDPGAWRHAARTLLGLGASYVAPGGAVSVALVRSHVVPPERERIRAREGPHACLTVRCQELHLAAPVAARPGEPWLVDLAAEQVDAALTLAVAYEVARSHRGWLVVTDDPRGDVELGLCWPLDGPEL